MERLDFKIPEFVRVAWVSKRAETVWAPIISRLANFFIELEQLTLKEGYRTAIIQHINYRDLASESKAWLAFDKIVIPLSIVNVVDSYRSATAIFNPNEPSQFRCAITSPKLAGEFARVHDVENWNEVGVALGYPECCRKFFMKHWVEEKWFDTTYPMSHNWDDGSCYPGNNILLRWIGVRLVSHLPCSFGCEATKQIAEQNIKIAQRLGFKKEIAWLQEMLNWPIEWSSLHGIAIIATPVFKIVTATDALSEKAVVRLSGNSYPEEAGSGNEFPFKEIHTVKLTIKDNWTANGFKDEAAQNYAHQLILDSIGMAELKPKTILDLGCGNGLLLKKLAMKYEATTFGIDSDPTKNPDYAGDIHKFFYESQYDLVLVSKARIDEDKEGWKCIFNRLTSVNCKHLLIYDYTNNSTKLIKFEGGQSE